MMIDQGYGSGNPGYSLVAAARALRYAGRSYAALALHAGTMGPENAQAMMVEQCLLDPEDAALEVRRAAADPGVMYFRRAATVELRDEARQTLGPRFRSGSSTTPCCATAPPHVGIVQAGCGADGRR
jgi:hypothetical protein